MIAPVLPYLPSPRTAAPELGRRPAGRALARAIGLAQHVFGIALFVAIPAAVACGAIYCLLADNWSIYLRAIGFIVSMPVALVYLKSLLPRRMPVPAAVIAVKPESQPTPYAFLARVAADVGAPTPRQLWIGSATELRLRGRRSLIHLVRIGRYDIEVGLWLWHGLTLSELQAILTRTLAPLSRGRFERLLLAARSVLESLVSGNDFIDEVAETNLPFAAIARLMRGIHATAVAPLRLIGRALLRTGASGADALIDDLAAVRITGSDALVHAVLRTDFAAGALERIDRSFHEAARDGIFTRDLYAHFQDAATALREAHNDFMLGETPTLRGPHAGKYADVFEPGQAYLSGMWAGFPPPLDREQNAKRTFVACERDDRPTSELLDDSKPLRERLTALHYAEMLGDADDYIAMTPDVVAHWLRSSDSPNFPARCVEIYAGGRPIEPGAEQERDSALRTDEWTDARLVRTAAGLYGHAGERAAQWRLARSALDKVLRRTIYRPTGREWAIAQDLEEDVRKAGRWFSALDRWVYVVHVHMAARLPNLALHDALLKRYESVLRLAPLTADAREYRNRVAAFVRKLDEYEGLAPYRLQRDSWREFKASRKDFDILLKEAAAIDDPLLREWIGELPLDQFLYSHAKRPVRWRMPATEMGQRLLYAWDEVVKKSRWLYDLDVAALLELQERINEQFAAQVGPLPPEEEAILEAIVLEQVEEAAEIELEPETIDLEPVAGPEVVQEDVWWD
jgi:hypothetical protein